MYAAFRIRFVLLAAFSLGGFVAFPRAGSLRAGDPAELPPAQVEELRVRFSGVKAWQVAYRYSGDNPFAWTEQGVRHVRTEWSEASAGEFILPVTERGETSMQANGTGPSHDMVHLTKLAVAPYSSETRFDEAQGTGSVRVELELDFTTGTYRFALFDHEFSSTYGGSHRDANGIRSYGPSAGRTHVIIPVPGSDRRPLKLPATGTALSGAFSHEDYVHAQAGQINGFNVDEFAREQPTHGRLEWTITPAAFDRPIPHPPPPAPPIQDPVAPPAVAPGGLPDDIDLVITADDYDTWRPQAGPSETAAGNTLSIQARLVPRNGRPLTHRAVLIAFSLPEVSHFPGVGGAPTPRAVASAADLGFETVCNPDAEIAQSGAIARFQRGPYESVTAVLSCFDARALGAVVVSARLDDGRVLLGHTVSPVADELPIPKRR